MEDAVIAELDADKYKSIAVRMMMMMIVYE